MIVAKIMQLFYVQQVYISEMLTEFLKLNIYVVKRNCKPKVWRQSVTSKFQLFLIYIHTHSDLIDPY